MAQCGKYDEWYHKECEQIPEAVFKRKANFICNKFILSLILSLYYYYYYYSNQHTTDCAILTTIITINIPQIAQQPQCILCNGFLFIECTGIPKMHKEKARNTYNTSQGYTNNNYIHSKHRTMENNYIIVHFGAPIDSWCLIHIIIPPFQVLATGLNFIMF